MLLSFALGRRPFRLLPALSLVAAFGAPAASAAPAGQPVVPGETFQYTGTYSGSDSYYPGPYKKPFHENITETLVVSGNASFGGRTGLLKLESYYGSGSPTDDYVGFTRHGDVEQERIFGAHRVDSPGTPAEESTTLWIPAGAIIAEFAPAKGQRWAATADSYGSSRAKDGSLHYTVADFADGSYRTAYSYRSPVLGDTSEYTALDPLGRAEDIDSSAGQNTTHLSFGVPVVKDGADVIPFVRSGGNALPAKPAPAVTTDVPDWLPGGKLPPRPLAAEVVTNLGPARTPRTCAAQSNVAAFDLRDVSYSTDPLYGNVYSSTSDEYDVPGLGDVCTIETDSLDQYDNERTGRLNLHETGLTITILTGHTAPKSADLAAAPLYGLLSPVLHHLGIRRHTH